MNIPFSSITYSGTRYMVNDSFWASETGLELIEKPEIEVMLTLINDVTAALEGNLKTSVSSMCSRCGCSLVFEVASTYTYIFRLGSDSSMLQKEFEFSDEDCYTVYIDEPVINIDEVLQEQLILSVPGKLLCSDECRGLCQNCGALLNKQKCTCAAENPNSPFAVLKDLKK